MEKFERDILEILEGKKKPFLKESVTMEELPELIKVLEKRNVHGKLPSIKMTLSDERQLIEIKDIENNSVPVISQRWSPIQSQCFKLSYTVNKKKKVKEIINMKRKENLKYNAGDITLNDLIKKKEVEKKFVNLNGIPDPVLDTLPDTINGISNSTFLLGTDSQTSVPMHIEDAGLGSLNLHHGGAPKEWVTIPPKAGNIKIIDLEIFNKHITVFQVIKLARENFLEEEKNCSNFMTNHKNIFVSTDLLSSAGIPFSTFKQQKG